MTHRPTCPLVMVVVAAAFVVEAAAVVVTTAVGDVVSEMDSWKMENAKIAVEKCQFDVSGKDESVYKCKVSWLS